MRSPAFLKSVTTCLIILLWSTSCLADNAPFGLNWGMTKSQAKTQGLEIYPIDQEFGLELFVAKELPKDLSIVKGHYELTFDSNRGLQQVKMVSQKIENDPSGNKGKELFSKLKTALIKKYGEPIVNYQRVNNKLSDSDNKFYQCLSDSECGGWMVIFGNNNMSINLELEGTPQAEGQIYLVYSGPNWVQVLEEVDKREAKSLEEAL